MNPVTVGHFIKFPHSGGGSAGPWLPPENAQICCRHRGLNRPVLAGCTKFGHCPVTSAHSLVFKGDRIAAFSLTKKIEGVKQTRSLTRSEVYPVGAASGAQAKSLSHRKMTKEGKQGSIAKRWSRRT